MASSSHSSFLLFFKGLMLSLAQVIRLFYCFFKGLMLSLAQVIRLFYFLGKMDSKIAPIAESSFLFWGSKQKLLRKAGKWIPKMPE